MSEISLPPAPHTGTPQPRCRLAFQRGHTWLRARLRLPTDLVSRVRLLFICYMLFGVLSTVPVLVFVSAQAWWLRVLGVGTVVVVCRWWLHGYRRGSMPIASSVAEAVGLFVVALAIGDIGMFQGVLYTATHNRVLYTPGRRAFVVWASYVAAYAAAIIVLTGNFSNFEIVGVTSGVLLVSALGSVLVKHQQTLQREQTLRQLGTALEICSDHAAIHAAALEAVRQVVPTSTHHAALLLGEPAHMTVVAATDPGTALHRHVDLQTLAPLLHDHVSPSMDDLRTHASALHQELRSMPVALIPLRLQHKLNGALVVCGRDALPQDTLAALAAIATQTGVALERTLLADDLQAREARFRSLVQHASDAIVVAQPDGSVQYVSPSVERVLGYAPDLIGGTGSYAFVHHDDKPHVQQRWAACIAAPGTSLLLEMRCRHADGTWRHLEALCTNLRHDPHVAGIVVNARDITERKTLEQQLQHQAFHDALTGLPNRRLFMERLFQALRRAERHSDTLAVLFLDLDRFKIINDSLGHEAGDQLLIVVGQRLRAAVRPLDTVARLGGDEFTLLIEHVTHTQQVVQVAERIADALALPIHVHGHDVNVTTSVGIALSTTAATPDDLLRCADMAMYEAKNTGKARYAIFDQDRCLPVRC